LTEIFTVTAGAESDQVDFTVSRSEVELVSFKSQLIPPPLLSAPWKWCVTV